MKKVSAVYITVRIDVEHPDMDENLIDEVLDDVVSNLYYDLNYKDEEEGLEIIDTEICGINQEY
jgi:hypothetical protein